MDPEERSYGSRSLIDLSIFDPRQEQSKHKAYWAVGLGNLLGEGWRLCYTDGTGRKGEVAEAYYSEDKKGNAEILWGVRRLHELGSRWREAGHSHRSGRRGGRNDLLVSDSQTAYTQCPTSAKSTRPVPI